MVSNDSVVGLHNNMDSVPVLHKPPDVSVRYGKTESNACEVQE